MAYDDEIVSQIRLRAVDETGDVMRGMSQRISDTTSAFAKLGTALGGGEIIRRSYMQFAELTQTLEQVKFATQASDKQMADLSKTIEAVGKQTGRSANEIATGFRTFFTETGQQLGPAMTKTFETIAQASTITGASVENLSRTAAAAMNNMKVPADQIDLLVKKWAVELPDALEGFSAKAPQIMATAQALGFGGMKNAEELGNLTAIMNRTFGQTRISASVLDNLLNQMRNTSTQFGREMTASMMEVKERGGDLNDVFTEMFKRFDAIKDAPPFALDRMGLTPQLHQGLQTLEDGFKRVIERIKAGEDPIKAWNDGLERQNKGPMSAVNELKESIESLEIAVGKLLQSFGANQAIKDFVDQLESFRRLADDISEGEYSKAFKEAVRPLNGPIPGEEHPAEPGPQASPYSGSWQGTALSRPGIAIWNALRGMSRGGKAPPKMAEGGIVTEPTFAEIGEAGPEAVVPLSGSNSTIGRDTQENTSATKDNTTALNRIASYMRDTSNHRGIYTNAAYTPGAGEAPTPSSAGLYGDHHGATGSWDNSGDNSNGGRGASGSFGGGRSGGPTFRPSIGPGSSGGRSHSPGGGEVPRHFGGSAQDVDPNYVPHDESGEADPALGVDRQHRFGEELKANPGLLDRMAQISVGENTNPRANQAVIESIFNRASARGISLEQAMTEVGNGRQGYYPASTFAGGARNMRNPKMAAMARAHIQAALAKGANVSHYATDNSSQGLAYTERYGGASGGYGRPGQQPGKFHFESEFGGHGGTGSSGMETFFSPGWGGGARGQASRSAYLAWRAQVDKERGVDVAAKPEGNLSQKFDNKTLDDKDAAWYAKGGSGAHLSDHVRQQRDHTLKEHQNMREEMERPIKMSVEAPQPPPLYTYRQRMARQQSRYQSDDQLGAPRYASHMDIGFA